MQSNKTSTLADLLGLPYLLVGLLVLVFPLALEPLQVIHILGCMEADNILEYRGNLCQASTWC